VLGKGDSARRVTADLNELHHVDVSPTTVLGWIKAEEGSTGPATEFDPSDPAEDFSGVLSVDATFRAVKAKKNAARAAGNVAPILYLTRLADGRLAAYWHEGSPKRRRPRPSRK
jgi:hypothetical protein